MEDLIKALTIFLKYVDKPNGYHTHCEHDELTVCVNPADVSEEDTAELERLGFSPNSNEDGFYSFRHGSC